MTTDRAVAPNVAVLGKFQYACAMEELWARGFEALGCKVFRSQGPVGGVDLSFAVKTDWINPAQLSGKRVLYWSDFTPRFPAFHELAPGYDLAYTVHDEHIKKPNGGEYPYLPCGYCPQDIRFTGRAKWNYDVCFIGTYRPEREWIRDLFRDLDCMGHSVTLWGNGWGPGVTDVYGEVRNKIIKSSRVCLNWHYPGDSVNMRFFEALALGAFQVSDRAPGLEPLGFIPGKHYIPIEETNASAVIDKWLRRPIRRALIARAGHEAVRGHTYASRAKVVLEHAQLRHSSGESAPGFSPGRFT